MHKALILLLTTAALPLVAQTSLDTLMTPQEKTATGVANLTSTQKSALENWIDKNYTKKASTPEQKRIFLSLNINEGQKLLLSDQSLYEISPDDVNTAGGWLTPVRIEIAPSGDPQYPVFLTNTDSGSKVKARKVSK